MFKCYCDFSQIPNVVSEQLALMLTYLDMAEQDCAIFDCT